MSVTFRVIGDPNDENVVNLSNVNARELLVALRLPGADAPDLCGEVSASILARLCMAFVNSAAPDPELPAAEVHGAPGRARLVECGRRAGYVHDAVGRIWRLALGAGPRGVVIWE